MRSWRQTISRFLDKPEVHFLHVGKTGGTSLHKDLRVSYKKAPWLLWRHKVLLRMLNHSETILDIPSHAGIAFYVRHPLALLQSAFYNYHPEYQNHHFNSSDIPELVEWYMEFPDFQSWVEGLKNHSDAAEKGFQLNMHLHRRLEYYLINDQTLMAFRNRIVFVGLTEAFQEDTDRFVKFARMASIEKKLNASNRPNDVRLTESQIAFLESRFANDYSIYQTCLEIRKDQVEQGLHIPQF